MVKKIISIIAFSIVVVLSIFLWSHHGAIRHFPIDEKVVALTYDDGPNPPDTKDLLEVLKKRNVKATFFVKGLNVDAYPDDLRAIAAGGHEIGNHSYTHTFLIHINKQKMLEELTKTNNAIKRIVGFEPVLYRPPFGFQGVGVKLASAELGMKSILMDVSGYDWEYTDPQQIAAAVIRDVKPGSIILLHDGHGSVSTPEAQTSRKGTVAATDIIIEALSVKGYKFLTVSELLKISEG